MVRLSGDKVSGCSIVFMGIGDIRNISLVAVLSQAYNFFFSLKFCIKYS